jgi:hypothetical protein
MENHYTGQDHDQVHAPIASEKELFLNNILADACLNLDHQAKLLYSWNDYCLGDDVIHIIIADSAIFYQLLVDLSGVDRAGGKSSKH